MSLHFTSFQLYDLLVPKGKDMAIRQDSNGNIVIPELAEVFFQFYSLCYVRYLPRLHIYSLACVQTQLVYRNRIELNSEFSISHSTQFHFGKPLESARRLVLTGQNNDAA